MLLNLVDQNRRKNSKNELVMTSSLFSRRFSSKESTIVMAFRLRPPEVTKIVLSKVLQNFRKTSNCTCWPKELKEKGSTRNILYRTRLKGSPFQFFSALRDFFRNKNSPKGPLFNFFSSFPTDWILRNHKGSPFQFFSALRLFKKFSGAVEEITETLKSFCYF